MSQTVHFFVFFFFISSCSAFLFPMPGGGGGGGCGCGAAAPPPPPPCAPPPPPPCAPPPPPSCGCGRKKRDVEDGPIHGTIDFPLVDQVLTCNSEELRDLLEQKMGDNSSSSISSLKNELNEKFFVVCSSGVMNYAAPRGTIHCARKTATHFCQIFQYRNTYYY